MTDQSKDWPRAVGEASRAAAIDAATTSRTLLKAPVSGLTAILENMGPARSAGVGVAFLVAGSLASGFGFYKIVPGAEFVGTKAFFFFLLASASAFAAIFASCAIARKAFGTRGCIESDLLISGTTVLPVSLWAILSAIVGLRNIEFVMVLCVFAACLIILMFNAGLTQVTGLSETQSAITIPIAFIAAAWLAKIIVVAAL